MIEKSKLDASQIKAIDAMQATADFLFTMPNASSRLLYVATAFREYLAGNYQTTDKALGLRLGRGEYERPEDETHVEMICAAFLDIGKGKAFRTVAELNGYDEREFRRLYDRYKYRAIERLVNGSTMDDIDPQ